MCNDQLFLLCSNYSDKVLFFEAVYDIILNIKSCLGN